MKKKLRFVSLFGLLLLIMQQTSAQTSWKGTSSTNWKTAANWTAGIPTSTVDAIIGDSNFTGANQPTINNTSVCKHLIIGNASKVTTLNISRNLTVYGNLVIGANGTLLMNTSNRNITLKGNWTNSGTYTATKTSAKIIFSASGTQILTGVTAFQSMTINSGATVTLASNISVASALSVSGTLNPTAAYVVSGAGTMTVNSTGTIQVHTANFSGNYTISGSVSLNGTSTVNYASASLAQNISSSYTYGILRISGGSTKSLTANLPGLNSSTSTSGSMYVDAGILNLSSYTANRNSSGGGSVTLAAGTQLRIGGTVGFPANYTSHNLASTSTVEYYGNNQSVLATSYGNLSFSGTSGVVTKTMPATALTISGNFSSSVGTGTSVSYTAAQNITVNKDVTIGTGCTFSGASFTHTFLQNWINSGTFTGSSSSVIFRGVSANLSGTGTHGFFNLTFSEYGITANSNAAILVAGNLATTAPGIFTHSSGGTLTMSGASKTISGNGFSFSNLLITGNTTTAADFYITGNFTNNGTFSASAGMVTMSGASKTISGSATPVFYALSILGSISTAVNFTLLSNLAVASNASLTATAGTAIFNGTSNLSGTANLYNVTINATKSLVLGSTSILGVASVLTPTGTLDVTTIKPNTVNYNGSGAQNITGTTYHNLDLSTGGTKTAAAAITVNNDFTINTGVTFNASTFVFSLYRHWNNYGTFAASSSDVQLRGNNAASITGLSTFNTFTVNKSSQAIKITLENNITAAGIIMTTGNMATGTNSITTTGGRSGNGIILGTVVHNHTFANATAYAFEGPNNLVTFTNPSGISSVTMTTKIGEIADFDPAIESLTREYEISVNSGTYTSALLRLHYENNELNAFSEPFLSVYKFNSGILWDSLGFSGRDTAANYVQQSGIAVLPGRYTGSGIRNIVRWNGSVSSNWNTAANWTTISGTSMANRVPNSTDAAQIGAATFTNQPTISSTQQVSILRFGSAQAVTLTISSGSLTSGGSVRGQWSTSRSHVLDVSSGALVCGTDLLLSDGVSGHDIELKIGSGTATTNYHLKQSSTGAINFTGSGSLVIKGDYIYTAGSFTRGTGTVVYSGGEAQVVAPLTYYHLSFTKTTERATFNSAATVNGNLSLSVGGEVMVSQPLTVVGNITIGASTTFIENNTNIMLGGNWSNSGTFISGSGAVRFNGSGSQSVNPTSFNTLQVYKPSGTLTLSGNISIEGDLTINSGTLDIGTYLADRNIEGGVFSMDSTATLKIAGANNLPDNFLINTLHAYSNVEYNGTIAQNIRKITYGHLIFSNGTTNAKSMTGNMRVNGNFTINSGSTFNADIHSMDLYGNFVNNGTFTAGTGSIVLNGVSKTITGSTTFNNISLVNGSYTVSTGTTSISGNLYIQSTGYLNFGSNNTSLDGDLFNAGSLISNGTATFTGTRVQTLQLLNSISSSSTGIINFNGTVSPIVNSTSSPSYATVNINNTGGVSASVPWFVYFAFNIASGATFNGGALTHTIYGSFTNNGTVTSSGLMKFTPGAPYSASATIRLDGTAFTSTGEVEFGGTAPITILQNNPTLNVVSISNTNVAGVTAPGSWTIGDEFRVSAGATFNAGSGTNHLFKGSLLNNGTFDGQTSTVRFDGSPVEINGVNLATFNNLTILSTGDLTLNKSIYVKSNLVVDGLFAAEGRVVIFTGSTASVISGSGGTVYLGDMEVSKTGTTTTLSVPVYVSGDLILTDGKIITTNANILTLEDHATSTTGTATSFVSGPMKKIGNDDFVFPLGKGSTWARLGISAPSDSTDEFVAEYFNTAYSNTSTMAGSPSPVLNDVSVIEYWICNRVLGTSAVKVELFWETSLSGINNYSSDLVVARWNGSAWENKGQSAINPTRPGSVTSNTVTAFSPFTFGSLSGSLNPLPITLLSFEGQLTQVQTVDLNWKTVSEINNDYFTLERSSDGIQFEVLQIVDAVGNTSGVTSYQYTDLQPFDGVSFYRLKQTDINGKSTYSKIITMVRSGLSMHALAVFPNPSNGLVTIQTVQATDAYITIRDIQGKVVFESEVTQDRMSIDLTGIENGLYIITLQNGDVSNILKFVKQ